MSHLRRAGLASLLVVALCMPQHFAGQATEAQLRERLVGQPLYLRGMWHENTLEFDALGKPRKDTSVGPLTLSGVDVKSVSLKGKRLAIAAERVALVADSNGVLQRKTPSSSTLIFGSMMPKGKRIFQAKQEMKIIINAGEAANFEPALSAVFADGLAEMAASVPSYWSCYAGGYFQQRLAVDEARRVVKACVLRKNLSQVKEDEAIDGEYVPPRLLRSDQPTFPPEASELGAEGTTHLHCTVTRKGMCVGFQVVQAVGAGVDEALLGYLYRAKFEPGMKDGIPVNADYEAVYEFKTERP